MPHYSTILVTFVAVWLLFQEGSPGTVLDQNSECPSTEEETKEELTKCVKLGEKFLRKYLERVRGRRSRHHNKCKNYDLFVNCIETLEARCPTATLKLDNHWIRLNDTMHCACNGSRECQQDLRCFEKQYRGILCRRCDAHYRFSLKQKIHTKCLLLYNNIRCKEVLISSACGQSVGEFAYHVSSLAVHKHIRRGRCYIPYRRPYDGFTYSENCPADFPDKLRNCRSGTLALRQLIFNDKNDLVADGEVRDIRYACRLLKRYKRCVRPIREACPNGTDMVYEFDGRLRTYLLKIDYICKHAKKVYIGNLPCYQQVIQNQSLQNCVPVWQQLSPLLRIVNAHQYYCQPHSNQSSKLQIELDKLRNCYHQVFKDGCGDVAADVVDNMMQRAFADPYYLRYKYKPDCSQIYNFEPEMTIPPDVIQSGHNRGQTWTAKYHLLFGIGWTLITNHFLLLR